MTVVQGSYAEAHAAPPRQHAARRAGAAVSGAGLLSAAMVASGVLTYAFLVVAARSLGPTEYGRIGALWAAMFIAAIVLFRPLEQTASRAIADRRARGEEVRSVVVAVARVGGVLMGLACAVAAAAWTPLSRHLFGGDASLTALLLVGIGFYGLSYLVRGLLGGALWFNGYGINLLADGVGRLALALPLLVVASRTAAGIAVVGAGLAGALVPLFLGRRRLSPLLERRQGGERFHVARALRFAGPAGVIAAADQILVNGAPLLVLAGGGPHATKTAGLAFAATMLVRAPVYVFQGVAAALLPNLARLNATDGAARLRDEATKTAKLLVGIALVVVAACWLGGPLGMHVLYGHEYAAPRSVFAWLGLGVALYIVAATFSQALLAVDAGRRAAVGWAASAVALVAAYALLPGGELSRVAASFAIGALVLLAALARLVYVSGRS